MPTVSGYTFFDTAIGICAIAWSGAGICGVMLPERDEAVLRERLRRRHAEARECPPPQAEAADAIAGITALLSGKDSDLGAIRIDLEGRDAFQFRLYALARAISPGRTRTYGELAEELGGIGLSRAVGQAMGANPVPIIVPCHRVLAAKGKMGGFSAPGGAAVKRRILEIERAAFPDPSRLL
ncbi:MAG: methylated-DNA--[protein]-cysteine S-methyltransferase [Alphaproteobacteria bacterium]|nr:methylated-DNA--[protein]-cysteine S-methyltransferase [Alphaproteobacteria bacterium]